MQAKALSGQVAIVTGGGRGLGRAIALALAEAGAVVAIAGRSVAQLDETVAQVEQRGGRAFYIAVDVTDQTAVRRMAVEVERKFGAVDLLVNNAGVLTPIGPLWEVDAGEWWRCLDVNLRGSFLCAQAVLPGMIARRRGRILNVASDAGMRAIAYASAYVASKTALIRLSEQIAVETRDYGISTFAVTPGTVQTDMTDYLYHSAAGQKWAPWFREIFDEGRDDPVEEVTRLVLSLARGEADVLSGCTIDLDDDIAAMVKRAEQIGRDRLYMLRLARATA